MAASCKHVGQFFQRNSRLLLHNFEQSWGHRTFCLTSALQQQAEETVKVTTETIVIPRRKTWSKEAVLEALAATVSRDPTAFDYQFQDDPYLFPRTSPEFRLFSLSQESGRASAKFIVNNNPKFFMRDYAEPHIPCLMPETISLFLDEVSEEALKERIKLRKVNAAVDMYDQLLQAGTSVSKETTHDLLDLICLYCDIDPTDNEGPEIIDVEEAKKKKGRVRRMTELPKTPWKENNNAERIFNLLPERDTRCYSALIRGMVKHGAYTKAFSTYTDLLNNRLTADIHIFNALILAAPEVRDKYHEKWDLIVELLTQMEQQKIQPNLLTFNSVLKSLRQCGTMARQQSSHVLNEMKALKIAPSLATYDHLLGIFFQGAFRQGSTEILQDLMSEMEGTNFTCQDPDDSNFFLTAMKICLDFKDLQVAYKVHSLLEYGQNWKFLGSAFSQGVYYGRFFNVVCLMESIDNVLKWYKQLIPSRYYPNSKGLIDMLQSLDTDSRLDLLPSIWKDTCSLGHDNKADIVEEMLHLMARDTHSPEMQESFAECALDIKTSFDKEKAWRRTAPEWSSASLSNITFLLLRANKTQQAWEMLPLFQSNNKIPTQGLFEEFLSACLHEGSSQRAVQLVQLSATFCLSSTPALVKKTLAEFDLTDEQRAVLTGLESAADFSE